MPVEILQNTFSSSNASAFHTHSNGIDTHACILLCALSTGFHLLNENTRSARVSLSKLLAMGFVASHPDHDTYMEKIVKEFGAKASESLQFMRRHEDGPLNASACPAPPTWSSA